MGMCCASQEARDDIAAGQKFTVTLAVSDPISESIVKRDIAERLNIDEEESVFRAQSPMLISNKELINVNSSPS